MNWGEFEVVKVTRPPTTKIVTTTRAGIRLETQKSPVTTSKVLTEPKAGLPQSSATQAPATSAVQSSSSGNEAAEPPPPPAPTTKTTTTEVPDDYESFNSNKDVGGVIPGK